MDGHFQELLKSQNPTVVHIDAADYKACMVYSAR